MRSKRVKMSKYITVNKIRCTLCGDTIESKYRHNFVSCSCGRVSVDGGREYRKISFTLLSDYEDLGEYEEVVSDNGETN